jgi:hypothetical protein
MKLYDEVKDKPAFDLRQKTAIDPTRTDLQIFMGLSNDDVWTDAELPSVFCICTKMRSYASPMSGNGQCFK